MQHPLGGCVVLKYEIECTSRGECCSPSFRGPHKIAYGDFAGSPIRAFLPHCVTARARLRGGVNFAAHLSHGCSFSPSEYAFGGDPLEGSVLLKCGICFSSFLIEFESRIKIIERRTALTKRRSLCPTENTFGGDPELPRRSSGGYAACERLSERRVKPSSTERTLYSRMSDRAIRWARSSRKRSFIIQNRLINTALRGFGKNGARVGAGGFREGVRGGRGGDEMIVKGRKGGVVSGFPRAYTVNFDARDREMFLRAA